MSPDNPQDPQKGKPDEVKVAEDAAAAKVNVDETTPAQPEPESDAEKSHPAPLADGTAAAETGVAKLPAATADDVGGGDERSEAGEREAEVEEPPAAPGDDDPAVADQPQASARRR